MKHPARDILFKVVLPLTGGFLAIGLTTVLVCMFDVRLIRSELQSLGEFRAPALYSALQLYADFTEATQEGYAYAVAGQAVDRDEYQRWADRFRHDAAKYAALAQLDEERESQESELFADIQSMQTDLTQRADALFHEVETADAVSAPTFQAYEAAQEKLFSKFKELIEIENNEVQAAHRDARAIILRAERLFYGIGGVTLLMALLAGTTATRSVMRFTGQLTETRQQLRDTSTRLEIILQSLPVISYTATTGSDFTTTYVSRNAHTITGFEPGDFTSDASFWMDRIHPQDRPGVLDSISRLDERDEHDFEYRWRVANGSYRTFYDFVRVVRGRGGDIDQIVGMIQDVTDRRVDEADLRIKEQAIASSNTGIAMGDMDGRIIYVNQAFLKLWGYDSEREVVGRLNTEFGQSAERVREIVAALKKHGSWSGEMIAKKRNGSPFTVEISTAVVRDSAGVPTRMTGSFVDITDRKRAEIELRRFKEVLEATSDLVFMGDPSGRVFYMNSAGRRMLGFGTDKDVRGQNASGFYADSTRDPLLQEEHPIRDGVWSHETELRTRDGRVIPTSEVIVAHKSADGRVEHLTTIARDISERKRLEKQLMIVSESEQQRIGHDLHDGVGQILTGIALKAKALHRMLAARAAAEAQTAAEIEQHISEAVRQTRALAAGLSPLDMNDDDFATALRGLTSQVRQLFGVTCVFSCDAPVPIRDRDMAIQLFRIAQEAIHNAVRHAQPSHVSVHLGVVDKTIRLTITDDGTGSCDGQYAQNGMGIRLMRYRAQLVGGSLQIGRNQDGGTTVDCALPRPTAELKSQLEN